VNVELVQRIADLSPADWDALDTAGNPFLRHAFLEALESTGRVGGDSGWQPLHLALTDSTGRLVGAVPQYAKSHSWGEFVFDWSWAQSYARAGLDYYPKLVCAIPFTPVTGPRLLVHPGADRAEILGSVATALTAAGRKLNVSGIHVNFLPHEETSALEQAGFLRRHDCRFLWTNRGYTDFEQYLASFRSDKRKKARRERRRVEESGITFRTLHGAEIDVAQWQRIFCLSEQTFLRHGNGHYLSAEFLAEISRRMPESVMVKIASRDAVMIAAAIFFVGGGWLYGRYWGAAAPEDSLHFETCYYQGIEYCIEHGLHGFDPGTQGEHKLARGFEPTATVSEHWIAHPGFAAAIDRYLQREREAVDEYIASARDHLPFLRGPAA
jgi:hypothetical protein